MSHWIFKCNPKRYRIDDRLADPNPNLTWTVTRYTDQIQSGDTVYLWVTGPQRGIRAVLLIDANPQPMAEMEREQSYLTDRDTEIRVRVLASLENRSVHLLADDLKDVPGLENLSMFHGFQQQTNFAVTAAEGAIIDALVQQRAAGRSAAVKS